MSNDLVPSDDAEILEHMFSGVESEKEAADEQVSRMLREEQGKGRGVEVLDDEGRPLDGQPQSDTEDAESKDEQVSERKPNPEETDSQRRRRLRKESVRKIQARNEELKRENERLKTRIHKMDEEAPDPRYYGDDQASYIADRAAYVASRQQAYERYQEIAQESTDIEAKANASTQQDVQEFLAECDKNHPGLSSKITAQDLPITPAMVELLLEEGDHDLAQHLASNPGKTAEIANLQNPILQAKALWKEQAALHARAAAAKVTKAPEPIKPVRGSGAAKTKSPSEMSFSEYVKYRGS